MYSFYRKICMIWDTVFTAEHMWLENTVFITKHILFKDTVSIANMYY